MNTLFTMQAVESKSVCSKILSSLFSVAVYINGWIPTITIIKLILKKSELINNSKTCKSNFVAYLNYEGSTPDFLVL